MAWEDFDRRTIMLCAAKCPQGQPCAARCGPFVVQRHMLTHPRQHCYHRSICRSYKHELFGPMRATVSVRFDAPGRSSWESWPEEFVGQYPSARGWLFQASREESGSDEIRISVSLTQPDSDSKLFSAAEMNKILDDLAPEYRYLGNRFLRPSVEDKSESPPSP
jgi:hypothetical protein